jgi:thioredoxin-like negative regulator of GroEL
MRTLYKFSTPWCAPCKTLSKTLAGMLSEFPDIEIIEVDIEKDPTMANQMRVRSVPTLMLDGRMLVGTASHSRLQQFLKGNA